MDLRSAARAATFDLRRVTFDRHLLPPIIVSPAHYRAAAFRLRGNPNVSDTTSTPTAPAPRQTTAINSSTVIASLTAKGDGPPARSIFDL